MTDIRTLTTQLTDALTALPLDEQVQALNEIRAALHAAGPFAAEPVDHVVWVKADRVQANSYNPNKVARPEMDLLDDSISSDGFTQPIVGFPLMEGAAPWAGPVEVVDGFHRHLIGQRPAHTARLHGYLPVAPLIKDLGQRMASTVRHNRARGKHEVELMSGMVVTLLKAGHSDLGIAEALGMEAEEVLRLKQMTGLAGLYKDQGFSRAWEVAPDDV